MAVTRKSYVCIAVAFMLVAASATLAADDAGNYTSLIERHAAALVTVKFVPTSPSGEKQKETEATGMLIGPKGLVLCANTQLGGNPWGRESATPADLKVLIGEDTEGLAAELVSRDSERDLAWVQITAPLPGSVAFLDFEKSVDPTVGQSLIAMRLADQFFGRVPILAETRVGGHYTKPRDLFYVPAVDQISEPGLPFFTADGELVGVTVIQVPDLDAVRLMGRPLNPRDIMVVLPGKQVVKATQLAREQYEQRKAEEKEGGDATDSAAPETKEDAPADAPATETKSDDGDK
ncbi:MAG: trypsin-like peptidase domain-containing protein [Phycisphaerae bacterium]|nr:trypsin-like peptidase domain-containing protein [Phycisphaerae bacterium]